MDYSNSIEYLTPIILSGITFDLIKAGVTISAESLKDKLKGWLISDLELNLLASNINKIENIETLSQIELAEKFDREPAINCVFAHIQQDKSINSVNQSHTGSGHNISGNVTINNN